MRMRALHLLCMKKSLVTHLKECHTTDVDKVSKFKDASRLLNEEQPELTFNELRS